MSGGGSLHVAAAAAAAAKSLQSCPTLCDPIWGRINAKTPLDCVSSVQGVARSPGWWDRSKQGESGRKKSDR